MKRILAATLGAAVGVAATVILASGSTASAATSAPTWFPQAGTPFVFGAAGDRPLAGDWNGDGNVGPGVRRGTSFLLRARPNGGAANYNFVFGKASDTPVVGDWDGNGSTTIGVWRAGIFYLRNTNSAGPADITIGFGRATDQPIVGDWNGDGTTDIGVRRGNIFYLQTAGTVGFGRATDQVLVGDWNGDGRATLAVRRGATYYLSNNNTTTATTIGYGRTTDIALVGDMNRDGRDELILVRFPVPTPAPPKQPPRPHTFLGAFVVGCQQTGSTSGNITITMRYSDGNQTFTMPTNMWPISLTNVDGHNVQLFCGA